MRRYGLVLLAFACVLGLTASSPALAVYPTPDTYLSLQMYQGWYDDNLAWYICTDTSNIRFAYAQYLTLAPMLDSAWGVAAEMYLVTNPEMSQGPIFSERPGNAGYSGIWTVWFVTWTDLIARGPLTSEQEILDAQIAGDLVMAASDPHIVVDYPIVALGRLGGPWLAKPDPPFYRIRQAIGHDPYAKTITLPAWDVFCDDPITRRPATATVIIPDVGDATLASELGANLAPDLLNVPIGDTQSFWVMSFPKPPSQLPVIEDCPDWWWWNLNFNYTPVMRYTVLQRNIPQWAIVNNDTFLQMLIGSGGLVVTSDTQRINAPVIPLVRANFNH